MIRGIFVNILILGFLLTLYIYINTDSEKTIIKENSAHTEELNQKTVLGEANAQEIDIHEDITYQIENGDSLSSIGEKFNVPVSEIKEINGLRENSIKAGDYIDIPNIEQGVLLAQGQEEFVEQEEFTDEQYEGTEPAAEQSDLDQVQEDEKLRAQEERKAERERRRKEMMRKREELKKKGSKKEKTAATLRQIDKPSKKLPTNPLKSSFLTERL